jgi:hypothetical protein
METHKKMRGRETERQRNRKTERWRHIKTDWQGDRETFHF